MGKRSQKFLRLPEYPLSDLSDTKKQLASRGVEIIDLGAGDVDLSPPIEVIQTLSEACRQIEMSRY